VEFVKFETNEERNVLTFADSRSLLSFASMMMDSSAGCLSVASRRGGQVCY
jgi:hypothetical protein